jgi:hypothetical protein
LYNNNDGILGFSEEGLSAAQSNVNQLFVNSEPDNMPNVLALCLNPSVPGICDVALSSYCSSYTRENLTGLNNNFCGCYVPPDPTLNVSPQCDPLCNNATVVRKADKGNRITCDANICIINDVSVLNRGGNVNVNFNNICPGCRNGSNNDCVCIVNSSNIGGLLGSIGITTNINQFCGSQSTCSTVQPDGSVISTPCTGYTGLLSTNNNNNRTYTWILLIMFLIIVLVFLIFRIFFKY